MTDEEMLKKMITAINDLNNVQEELDKRRIENIKLEKRRMFEDGKK